MPGYQAVAVTNEHLVILPTISGSTINDKKRQLCYKMLNNLG